MNNLLLVTAHPYKQSFNFALRNQTLAFFKQSSWIIEKSDLYQQAFNPLLGTDDFVEFNDEVGFNLAQQQSHAINQLSFHPEIKNEQTKLLKADLIILQFPLWWGSFPAILKGWIERILSYDFAYGGVNQLAGKLILFSVTTGGVANFEEEKYYADKISRIESDIFDYLKMNILPTFISHGPARKTEKQRKTELNRLEKHLANILRNI